MTPTNPELRQFIIRFFSDEELETLCFDYFPEAANDFGGGMSKNRKVIKLIEYCTNLSRLGDLNAALFHERQDSYWERFRQTPDNLINVDKYVEWVNSRPDKMYPGSITISSAPKPGFHIHEKTGIELIRIPAGAFLYGDDKKPMTLPEYWIGRYPVTNSQYKRFLNANPQYPVPFRQDDWASPYNWDQKARVYPVDKAEHPVVLVNWNDANAFCDWAGLQLPTEEQWEKAARGADGRIWPWGNEAPTDKHCNFNMNVGTTTPVNRYSPQGDSPYSCSDMAGNVKDWTGSWWYREGEDRVLRGGALNVIDLDSHAAFRTRFRSDGKAINIGFRVAELLSDPAS